MARVAHVLPFVLSLFTLLFVPASAAADPVIGSVTDATGAALIRAFVRLIDAAGRERAVALTDDAGRFTLDVTACGHCRIEASRGGFRTATLTITPAQAADAAFRPRVTLDVAPISDAIVVTPTRDGAPASQLGATVTVFTADDIARRPTASLADLLREAPGVAVVETAGIGGVTSLFLRGGESSYTKVLLDGIPLNEPGGAFNFSSVTTSNLARVEVVRGAQSALFGSDAMAGVIQLVTARGGPAARPALAGSIDTGGYATRRADGVLVGGGRGWDYSLGFARLGTDNRAANNRFNGSTLSWSAGRALSSSLQARATGRLEHGRAGSPGATAFGRADLDAFFDHADTAAGVSLEHRASSAWKQRVSYSLTRSRQDSTNLVADPPYTPRYGASEAPFEFSDFTYDLHNVLRRGIFSYQSDWRFGRAATQLVTAVVDWDGERATLADRLANTSLNASRNNIGVSVQHQVIVRRGSLVSSLRAEHNDSFGNQWVPRLSAALVLRSAQGAWGDLTLKANAGRGVKEPTILQSFSQDSFYLGNADLLPERARTADIGLSQRLANDRVRVEAVLFDNRYEDQISTRTTSFSPFRSQFFNIGNTNARGLEFSMDAAPARTLRLMAGYTLLDSEIIDSASPESAVFKAGNWTFRRPRHSAFVRAAWTEGRAGVDLDGRYVGRHVDSDFASLVPAITASGGYWTWNLAGRYRITTRLEGHARIQNLTDRDYMEPLGYPAWRRTAHVGLKVRF